MEQELKILKQVATDIELLKEKVDKIEASLDEIDDDLHEVKPEYLEKLKNIESGKFVSKKDFEKKFNVKDYL